MKRKCVIGEEQSRFSHASAAGNPLIGDWEGETRENRGLKHLVFCIVGAAAAAWRGVGPPRLD